MAENETGKSAVSMIPDAMKNASLKPTIQTFNFLIDSHYGQNEANDHKDTLRFNEMTGRPEYLDLDSGKWMEWTDAQDSLARAFFQSTYGLYSTRMLDDAFAIYFANHRVNPLTEILDGLKWDGKPRVEHFLHDVLKVEDNNYTRECSRLIFAGGIHRAYEPGCKFDDMIVLIGEQGCGKSASVRFLNMNDSFYREIKTISGKEGIEALRGVWIGEVVELMAMTKAREIEAVKAYITIQADSYRPPYAKHIQTIPRRCSFIGTTNNAQFLTDRTGNRRFYPVKCNSDGYKLLENEKKIRAYIKQAWAEAVQLYKEDNLQPFAKKEVLDDIRKAQEEAMQDDWRIGAIEQYLEDSKKKPNSTVSVIELWHRALNEPEESKPDKKDSTDINQIISSIPGWVRCDKLEYTPWGRQRVFKKVNPFFPSWK